jgi:hypothetical protein
MREITIGGVGLELPDWLDARDDDGTLVAYPSQSDYANVRVTVSTIAKDGQPSTGAGERITRSVAAKEQRDLQEKDGKVWYTYSKAASDGSPSSTITFWHVGLDAYMIVVSCFLDSMVGETATKKRVIDLVVPLIQSFRVADQWV